MLFSKTFFRYLAILIACTLLFPGCTLVELAIGIAIALIIILFLLMIAKQQMHSGLVSKFLVNVTWLGVKLGISPEQWTSGDPADLVDRMAQALADLEKLKEDELTQIEAQRIVDEIKKILDGWKNGGFPFDNDQHKKIQDGIDKLKEFFDKLKKELEDLAKIKKARDRFQQGATAADEEDQRRRAQELADALAVAGQHTGLGQVEGVSEAADELREKIKEANGGRDVTYGGPANAELCGQPIMENLNFGDGGIELKPGCCITITFSPPITTSLLWFNDWLEIKTDTISPRMSVKGKKKDDTGWEDFTRSSGSSERWDTPSWGSGRDYPVVVICNTGEVAFRLNRVTPH
ncbi:MAG: hypothetical protein HY089_08065 [Ignavibacteriales bacterium]|nr:hypothetical protein [Ignavibacteriales bacterium]